MLKDTFPMLVPELRRNPQMSIAKGLSAKRATVLEVVKLLYYKRSLEMCDIWLTKVALPSVQLTIQWTSIWRDQMIFLACIFFVIADYVMNPQ